MTEDTAGQPPVPGPAATGRPDPAALLRTLAFAAALILLLAFARSGSSVLYIQLTFAVFVIGATIWVRGQYVDSLDRTQWLIRRPVGIILVAIAIGLVVLHARWKTPNVLLYGALIVYFVAGSAVTGLRQGLRHATGPCRLLGPGLTAAGAMAALTGIVLLGQTGQAGVIVEYGLFGVAFLILLPVGIALSSEAAILKLESSSLRSSLWVGATGALLCITATAAFWAVTRSTWLLVTVGVLGLILVATVSTTQADIATVMAAVALMGVTPLPADEPNALRPDANTSKTLVALGDSYMSGEGASVYFTDTNEGGGNQCRRSPTAWAAMAGQQLPFRKVEFLACSGARTVNLQLASTGAGRPATLKPEPQAGEGLTQLDKYRSNHTGTTFTAPGLVVVSIGGNDAGFTTIGLMCLAPGNCSDESALWTGALEQVRRNLRITYQQIDAVFPATPVVIIPYPDPIKPAGTCKDVALSRGEREFIHSFVTGEGASSGLNKVIAETAAEFGFHYLAEMQAALADAHLQLCDPDNRQQPGLNFIGLRSVRGIAEERFNPANWVHGSLHPNERGHAAMLQVFESWLPDPVSSLPTRLPVKSEAAALRDITLNNPLTESTGPQCDLLDKSPAGCRPQGMQWAKGQLRRTLLVWGLVPAFALLGLWLVAVAAFGNRCRLHVKWTARTKGGTR